MPDISIIELHSDLVKLNSCSLAAAWFEWTKSFFVGGVSYLQLDTHLPVAWRTQWLCPSPTGRLWCLPTWSAPPSAEERKKAQTSHWDDSFDSWKSSCMGRIHTKYTIEEYKIYGSGIFEWKHQTCPHHVWRQRGLEVQQNANDRYLFQPLAAGLLAIFLVLAGVIEARPQCWQQLLCQCAQGTSSCLAEDHIPSQLQRCVWCWDGEKRC